MTNWANIKFTSADLIKAIGGVIFLGTMWLDLKTDQVNLKSEVEILKYQLAELKVSKQYSAILPKETKIETE